MKYIFGFHVWFPSPTVSESKRSPAVVLSPNKSATQYGAVGMHTHRKKV